MSQQSSDVNPKSSSKSQSLTLWEAMGKLHEIQTQEKIALDNADIELFQELLKQQGEAWEIVYVQVARLIATGKAPSGAIQRLEEILNIHRDRKRRLQEARAEIEARLKSLESGNQAHDSQQERPLAA
jgi:hypothetical protein